MSNSSGKVGSAREPVSQISSFYACVVGTFGLFVIVCVFSNALLELVNRWSRQEEYSHGFLIPVVTVSLLWFRREALRASLQQPSWAGPIAILLAMGMHVTGGLSAIYILSQLEFILALFGLVLGIGGFSLLRTALVPILFLLFAIPMPYFINSLVSFKLQLISSELGTYFIRMFQIPVYRDGNIIDLGNYKLQVVEACSGLRYIYPLLSLGFLAAYFCNVPFWQRCLLFLSTVPLTILMNGVRIGLVGITVNYWGTQAANDVLHFFEGWIIFVLCAGVLMLEIYCFARASDKTFFEMFCLPRGTPKSSGMMRVKAGSQLPLVCSLLLLCITGIAIINVSGRPEIIPDRFRFVAFPERIGTWQGHAILLEPEIERGLVGLDDYLLSDYKGRGGKGINFYVAYYPSQRRGESPHSPIVCIPGDGWQIVKTERTSYAEGGVEFPFRRVVIERNSIKQVVYYWFEERGRKIADEFLAKWYLFADAVVMNRTDGALVRLTTQIYDGEIERDADQRLHDFMRTAVPILTDYLPSKETSQVRSARLEPNAYQPP